MPQTIAQFLAMRGITPETIDSFLEPRLRDILPNPSIFKDMDKACLLLAEAIIQKNQLVFLVIMMLMVPVQQRYFIDFSVPFGTASYIHIPDRFAEGYGPNITALKSLKQQGAELIVTVDCGITAHRPLKDAHDMGMDIIVIDHHQAGTELPLARAVVNPNRLMMKVGRGALCAAAMVFMTCVGTMRTLREKGHFNAANPPIDLLTLLDLVGMATICDIVPLTTVNRAFCKTRP